MFRPTRLLFAAVAIALIALLPAPADAQGKRPAPPKKPAVQQRHHFMVQLRQPHWRPITVAPNRQVAQRIKLSLVRQGFIVHMKANRSGQVAIKARMPGWHTRAHVNNRPQANTLANVLRHQGWQARVIGR